MNKKRRINERKFKNWKLTGENGRLYFYKVKGKHGWSAKYLKEVDKDENTLRFWQEIYDENENLREIHEKFPKDKGHIKLD